MLSSFERLVTYFLCFCLCSLTKSLSFSYQALLSLCSDELTSAKGALQLCVSQMKNVLSSQYLPLHASTETLGRAYYATEIYVQVYFFPCSHFCVQFIVINYAYLKSFGS